MNERGVKKIAIIELLEGSLPLPDAEIARRVGCTIGYVREVRLLLKIRVVLDLRRVFNSRWEGVPFGVESDSTIARRLKVSRQAVRAARLRRGIGRCLSEFSSNVEEARGLKECGSNAIEERIVEEGGQ